MLTKDERKEINQAFWMEFRKFMSKVKSSNGRKMNWLNYPTDVKDLYLRLIVDSKSAKVCFDIQPKNQGVREIVWEQMGELKKVLSNSMTQDGIWEEHLTNDEGRIISRIYWEEPNVSLFKEEDQLVIFNFFKSRLVEFDEFYQEFKEILISLTK